MHIDRSLTGELCRNRPQREALAGLGIAPAQALHQGDQLQDAHTQTLRDFTCAPDS